MDQAERAFWLGVWRGFIAALSFFIISLCYMHSLDRALLAGAYIALIYSVAMWMDAQYWRETAARVSILRSAQSGSLVAIALCLGSRLV